MLLPKLFLINPYPGNTLCIKHFKFQAYKNELNFDTCQCKDFYTINQLEVIVDMIFKVIITKVNNLTIHGNP